MTYMLFVPAILAFFFTVVLTPLVRNSFRALQILDSPDGGRKVHSSPIPRIGGIPIALSYVLALGFVPLFHSGDSPWQGQQQLIAYLIVAAGIVFLTGLFDDVYSLRPWQKLLGQLAAAATVWSAGVRIDTLSHYSLSPWLAAPATAIWLIGCTNAFNLIDGLDGLASGMGLFATMTISIAALLDGNHMLALAALPLAGSLLGFLRYNFNPASVFLGDSGSLLIGFLLGCYGIIWSQKSATLVGMTAPLLAMAIPLLDVCLSILRRWLRNQPIFGPDRSHIHHKLLDRGLTHRRVVLLLYAAAGFCAALSLVQSVAPVRFGGAIVLLFCAAAWMGIQNLGYLEFGGACRALQGSSIRRTLRGQIALHSVEQQLDRADSIRACWEAICEASRQLGFAQVEANFHGVSYLDGNLDPRPGTCWQLNVPLEGIGYVIVSRSLAAAPQPAALAPFVEMLRERLLPRLVLVAHFEARRAGETASLARLAQQVDLAHIQSQDERAGKL